MPRMVGPTCQFPIFSPSSPLFSYICLRTKLPHAACQVTPCRRTGADRTESADSARRPHRARGQGSPALRRRPGPAAGTRSASERITRAAAATAARHRDPSAGAPSTTCILKLWDSRGSDGGAASPAMVPLRPPSAPPRGLDGGRQGLQPDAGQRCGWRRHLQAAVGGDGAGSGAAECGGAGQQATRGRS
jgi:hypothetical protein